MAKGGIILADTHDLTVNPGDGEQNYAFLTSLMIIWGKGGNREIISIQIFNVLIEIHFQNLIFLNEVAWDSFGFFWVLPGAIFFNEKILSNSTKNMHNVLVMFSSHQHFLLTTLRYPGCGCLPVLWDLCTVSRKKIVSPFLSPSHFPWFLEYCFSLISMQTYAYLYSNQYIWFYSYKCPSVTHLSNWDWLWCIFKSLSAMRPGRHFGSLWEGVALQWV